MLREGTTFTCERCECSVTAILASGLPCCSTDNEFLAGGIGCAYAYETESVCFKSALLYMLRSHESGVFVGYSNLGRDCVVLVFLIRGILALSLFQPSLRASSISNVCKSLLLMFCL